MTKWLTAVLLLCSGLWASEGVIERTGVLITQGCYEAGELTNCKLENFACGSEGCFAHHEAGVDAMTPLVLYSHDDNVAYKIDASLIRRHALDAGYSRLITVTGALDEHSKTITVHHVAIPEIPKTFYKGCAA